MTNSFLDKLKKGMGESMSTKEHISGAPKKDIKKPTELKAQQKPLKTESSPAKTKLLIKSRSLNNNKKSKDKKWFKEEGQLVIDMYQTETKLIIQTAIAGIDPEDLDVTIEKDLIIIKGTREEPLNLEEKKDYFVQECYWGPFSRKIILPVEINPDQVQASMRQGVLVIQLPKTLREKKRKIEIKE